MSERISALEKELLNSHWPKCNKLAEEIFNIGGDEAKSALKAALKAKRHHVRTSAIVNLAKFNDAALICYIQEHLNDSAYETRTEAKKAIERLTNF